SRKPSPRWGCRARGSRASACAISCGATRRAHDSARQCRTRPSRAAWARTGWMAESNAALPEFTRALRALGSRRGRRGGRAAGADQQARFFSPLVDARSAAAAANDAAGILAAFDATTLRAAFRETLDTFAHDRYPEYAPARRALEAELFDVAEPLFSALDEMHSMPAGEKAAGFPDALA